MSLIHLSDGNAAARFFEKSGADQGDLPPIGMGFRGQKILVMGLPGSGKTTLAVELAKTLTAAHYNADAVRATISKHLGFSVQDRILQAQTMRELCDQAATSNAFVVADFVCPIPETRRAFGPDAYIIWVDRIKSGRFADTNNLFVPPKNYDFRVDEEGSPAEWVSRIVADLAQWPVCAKSHDDMGPEERARIMKHASARQWMTLAADT